MSVVIIGAGHAGVYAAANLRKLDAKINITIVSAESNLPCQKPPLSKRSVFSTPLHCDLLQAENYYQTHNINLIINNKVKAIDTHNNTITLVSKKILNYKLLIIATGSKIRKLNISGCEFAISLNSIQDAKIMASKLSTAKNIVTIGGGFIGCEVATGAHKIGKKVTLLEVGPSIIGRSVAPIFAQKVLKLHRQQGITIVLNSKVSSINPTGVHTNLGFIKADLTISGIGVVPDTELADKAGITTDNGIVVNEYLQTCYDNIFAIGDVANFPFKLTNKLRLQSIQNANEQARVVAQNIIAIINKKELIKYSPLPWFWSNQGDLKLQMAGISTKDAKHYVLDKQKENTFTVAHFINKRLIAMDTLNHGLNHIYARKLLTLNTDITIDAIKNFNYDLKKLAEHYA